MNDDDGRQDMTLVCTNMKKFNVSYRTALCSTVVLNNKNSKII